jgi:two-component system nitrogen regulation response regulator NtrX
MSNILVVDDEAGIRELLREILHDEGHQVWLAESAQEARGMRDAGQPDLVLLDIWMPDTDGITLLKEWAAGGHLTMPVVMMSGHGTIDTAVEATKIGAYDFLEKPIALQKLLHTVTRALKRGEAIAKPRQRLSALGRSHVIADLKARLDQVAAIRAPVLLVGEPGSGFEQCAMVLHTPGTPWIAPADSAWLTDDPLEILQQAKAGVLFIADVNQLTRVEQKGLAFLLSKLDKLEVRLVCSAANALPKQVEEGSFDSELYRALAGVTLAIPPLRVHREDVPELAAATLVRLAETKEVPVRSFTTAALNALRKHDWPGNLYELESVVRSLAATCLQEQITLEDVERILGAPSGAPAPAALPLDLNLPLREARDAFEKIYFEHHIEKATGNMSRVAEAVGLERTHLYRKLKQLDIKVSRKTE